MAEINQDFFDKIYGPGKVTTENQMRDLVDKGFKNQFQQQSDQKLLNDITDYLIEKTRFSLPSEFLIKWIQVNGKKRLSEESARKEFEKSEKGIRYQLIEGKIISENDLNIKIDEFKDFAKDAIKMQMTQYGQVIIPDSELDDIVSRVMSNKDESKRLSEQLMTKKLLEFYKSKLLFKKKKVSFDAFIKEAYSKG